MRILGFAGSLRADSLNKKFVRAALGIAGEKGHDVHFIDLKELALPLYDGDIEAAGLPANLESFGEAVRNADALIVASPEYNAGISGALKNAIDWLSRLKPMPLAGKHVAILGASPGALGAVRGLQHTRLPFDALGAYVHPQMMGLPNAAAVFAEDGALNDAARREQLTKLLDGFFAQAARR